MFKTVADARATRRFCDLRNWVMKLLGKAGAHKVRVLGEGFRLLSPSVDSDAHNVCRQDDDVVFRLGRLGGRSMILIGDGRRDGEGWRGE